MSDPSLFSSKEQVYPCGCKYSGPTLALPDYCPEHGDRRTDPADGVRCMGVWLEGVGFKTQSVDCYAYAATVKALQRAVEEICQERATSPITRARLRHALAGVDWRKAK